MANQAITIQFKAPTNTRGARVSASAYCGRKMYAFNHELSAEENARAAARSFIDEMGWEGDFALAAQDSAIYVAILIPTRYIKARDAVISIRKAIAQGDLQGNPHAKKWGQQITDLTDGIQPDNFASEYARSI